MLFWKLIVEAIFDALGIDAWECVGRQRWSILKEINFSQRIFRGILFLRVWPLAAKIFPSKFFKTDQSQKFGKVFSKLVTCKNFSPKFFQIGQFQKTILQFKTVAIIYIYFDDK